MSFTAPAGFFEYAEITRLWPPRIPALPPPSKVGNGATLNLCAILLPFWLPSAYA